MKNSTQADMWARSDLKVAQAPLYPAPSLQPVVGLGDYYAREVQVTGMSVPEPVPDLMASPAAVRPTQYEVWEYCQSTSKVFISKVCTFCST